MILSCACWRASVLIFNPLQASNVVKHIKGQLQSEMNPFVFLGYFLSVGWIVFLFLPFNSKAFFCMYFSFLCSYKNTMFGVFECVYVCYEWCVMNGTLLFVIYKTVQFLFNPSISFGLFLMVGSQLVHEDSLTPFGIG